MSIQKRFNMWAVIFLTFMLTMAIVAPQVCSQPYWANMPPYNLLWPLWSPPLSPLDPITKAPTPLVNWLDRNTILPVQPAVVWDNVAFPKGPVWMLYNTPPAFGSGLLYWTSLYGLNPFPPSYLTTPSGYPIPNALAPGFSYLLPTKTKHFVSWVQVANLLYSTLYGVPYASLLSAADLWGVPPL